MSASASPEQIVRCCLRDFGGDVVGSIRYCEQIARNAAFNPWGDPATGPNYKRAAEILQEKYATSKLSEHTHL